MKGEVDRVIHGDRLVPDAPREMETEDRDRPIESTSREAFSVPIRRGEDFGDRRVGPDLRVVADGIERVEGVAVADHIPVRRQNQYAQQERGHRKLAKGRAGHGRMHLVEPRG